MWITYSVLSCKLPTSFSGFSAFILSCKMVNEDIEHQLQENIVYNFLHYSFYELFIKLRSIFYPLEIIYWKLLRHCSSNNSLFLSSDNSLFLSYNFMYLLLSFAYIWIERHSPPLIPFSTIANITISIKRSNFTLVKLLFMLNQEQKGNLQDQAHIF